MNAASKSGYKMRTAVVIVAVLAALIAMSVMIYLFFGRDEKALTTRQQWDSFKETFLSADGRIIDRQNGGISHSEGQGYGLLVAQALDDRKTFNLILAWSNDNLGPGLRAWSWGKRSSAKDDGKTDWGILDGNNASDGDILHAWALLMAGKKWAEPAYREQGMAILDAVRLQLVRGGYLLPGKEGFISENGVRLNLSYYIFPALREFSHYDADHSTEWNALYVEGTRLLHESLMSALELPPDWIIVSSEKKPVAYSSPRPLFGYESIRIPLYLAWEKEPARLESFRSYVALTAREERVPEFVYLDNGAFSAADGGSGHYAIAVRTAQDLGMTREAEILEKKLRKMSQRDKENYYASILALLARIY